MKHKQSGNDDHSNIQAVTHAVKALGIILNTGRVYNSSHPVFQRTAMEHLPVLKDALTTKRGITLFFENGKVYYGSQVLADEASTVERLAHVFEDCGVTGLTITPAVDADDIASLTTAIVSKRLEKEETTLQKILSKEGVRGIREAKRPKRGFAGTEASPVKGTARPSASSSRTFELDMMSGVEEMDTSEREGLFEDETVAEYRAFVADALTNVAKGKQSVEQASDTIAYEFEIQLNKRTEQVREETETQVRRLENIKDLVMQELEQLNLAAVVVDTSHNILEANHSGRALIGNLKHFEEESPLGAFIHSGKEKQKIRFNGKEHTAHIIISERAQSGEGAMLICLE